MPNHIDSLPDHPDPLVRLPALIEALVSLDEAVMSAERKSSEARKNETRAINELNAMQRRIDQSMAEIRKKSSRDSDWGKPMKFPQALEA